MSQTVEALKKKHSAIGLGKICGLFGKTRQGWYEGMNRADEEQVCERIIYHEIKRIRIKQPNSGLLKIYEQLKPFFEI